MHITDKEITRFWGKVKIGNDDECWPWIAKAKSASGYGVMRIYSMGRNIIASRISCILAHGMPPEGANNALHSCDNPPCCNPNHLRWGNQKDNVKDALTRGRASKPPVNYPGRHTGKMPKGNDVWNNSITEEVVREIFRLHMSNQNVTQIAEALGAAKHVVADVCRGRSWRHLDNIPSIEDLKKGGVRRGYNQFS